MLLNSPFYLPHRETIASPVRNKSMHTEEHFVGFKAMNGFRIEKDTYPVCFYAILGCFCMLMQLFMQFIF